MNHVPSPFLCVCEILSFLSIQICISLTGVVPLATYMRIYKKGDIVDIKVLSAVLCKEKLKQSGPVQSPIPWGGLCCCLGHKCLLVTLGAILKWQCYQTSSSTSLSYPGVCGVL